MKGKDGRQLSSEDFVGTVYGYHRSNYMRIYTIYIVALQQKTSR